MPTSVLRIAPFRALWLGQAISQLGDAFYYVTFLFMVNKVTGSVAMVGYVGALETVPFLLFGAYAGVLADRLDRKWIMLASDLSSGVILLLFAVAIYLCGKPPTWGLLATPFVLSSVRCFFMPAKSAAIPNLVPTDLVLEANSVSSTTQTIAPLIGLGLSASVLSLLYALSPMWFYLSAVGLNAASFVVSALFLFKLPAICPVREDAHDSHPVKDFREGIQYIRGRHDLMMLTLLLAVFRFAVAPFFVVDLAANSAWFGGKPQNITWFEFSFFVGMVAASAGMMRQKPSRPMIWFLSGLAVCGLSVAGLALGPWLWNFVIWCLVAGLSLPPADIPLATYLQVSVPDGFRGRVNAVREMIATGSMPLGNALGGIFVARYGIVATFLTMGILMTGVCFVGLLDPRFRNVRMPSDADPALDSSPEVAFIA